MTNLEKYIGSIVLVKKADNSSFIGRALANTLPEIGSMQNADSAVTVSLAESLPFIGTALRRKFYYGEADNPEQQEKIEKKVLQDIKKLDKKNYSEVATSAILPGALGGGVIGLLSSPLYYKYINEDPRSSGYSKINKILLSALLSGGAGAALGTVANPLNAVLHKLISSNISNESKKRVAKQIAQTPVLTGMSAYGLPSLVTGAIS